MSFDPSFHQGLSGILITPCYHLLLYSHILIFRGEDIILRKRLKQHMRRELVFGEPSPPWDLVSQMETNPYGLDYLCVLDFEATCEEVNPDDYLHEIIEFPVLLLNLKTLDIVSTIIIKKHTQ